MKIADSLKVSSGGVDFSVASTGKYCVEVSQNDGAFLQIGRISAAGFSGDLALPEKLRCHRTHDNLCAEFDSENVIPFGCEYLVKRHWTVFSNIALLNCDIAADNGGIVRDLELEPVEIKLNPAKVEFLIHGEKSLRTVSAPEIFGELYNGSALVLMLRVSDANGVQVEYVCGDDLWRHRAAEKIAGASANYCISADANGVTLTRKVLVTPEEVVMEKRPWKFKSIFAWRVSSDETAPESVEKFSVPGCFASAYAHRELRKVVRAAASGKTLVMQGEFPVLCDDPAHLERPAKHPVEHSDLASAAADYLWANRELAKRNSSLIMESSTELYGDSVVLRNLNSNITTFEEE